MLNQTVRLQIKFIFSLILAVLISIAVPPTYAAKVESIKSNNEPVELINKNANHFTDISLDLLNPDTGDKPSYTIQPASETEALVISTSIRPAHHYMRNSYSKTLLAEYGDNALVQESLNALYEVKQLWNRADAIANQFSYDVLYTLDLNQFVEDDLNNTYKPQSYQYDKVDNKIYDTIKRVQKTNKNKSAIIYQESTDDFLSRLLSKQTLYYLLALFMLFIILQRLTRFVLRLFP